MSETSLDTSTEESDSLLEKKVRAAIYQGLRGLREDEIDAYWEAMCNKTDILFTRPEGVQSLGRLSEKDVDQWRALLERRGEVSLVSKNTPSGVKLRLAPLSESEQKENAIVRKIRREFEVDRQKQIEAFQNSIVEGFKTWAAAYNTEKFVEAHTLSLRLMEYISHSAEEITLPLAVDPDVRFPGLVAPEAKKLEEKFSSCIKWVGPSEDKQQKIRSVDSITELTELTEDTFWTHEDVFFPLQAAAD